MKRFVIGIVIMTALALLGSCATGGEVRAEKKTADTNSVAVTNVGWTAEATAQFEADVPDFVRDMVRGKLEESAKAKGRAVIDMPLYLELKKESGH